MPACASVREQLKNLTRDFSTRGGEEQDRIGGGKGPSSSLTRSYITPILPSLTMAPLPPPSKLTLSICNRTSTPWIAHSSQFETEKTSQYQFQPAKSLQHITCHNVNDQVTLLSLNLLEANNRSTVLQEIHIQRPSCSTSTNTTKWKTEDVHKSEQATTTRLRVLHRCISSFHIQMLLLPIRDAASFLSSLSNDAALTSLCLPGTHESLALFGWPISTCQSSDSSIEKQLNDGIRYLDVRLAPKGQEGKQRLLAYHGITDERMEFGQVLQDCFQFLDGVGKNETIIMSLKQEQGEQDTFIKLLFTLYVDQSPPSKDGRVGGGRQRWFLEDRVPKLGEARGKIVMLSRFVIAESYGYPGGISPPIWPNSEKGMWVYRVPF